MHRFFFSLLLVFLPTQLGYHFWPAWSMVLGRRVDYLSPTLFFTDILAALTLLFWLYEKPKIFPLPHGRLLIIFVLFAFVNILFSASWPVALYTWIKASEFILLAYYMVRTDVHVSTVVFPLSIGLLFSSVLAIAQFFLQHSIGGPLWFLGERTLRADTPGIARIVFGGKEFMRVYATFPHPNVLGGYAALLTPLVVAYQSKRQRLLYTITWVSATLALFLTFSRSAWVVFVMGIAWWAWRKKKHVGQLVTLAAATLVFLFVVAPLSTTDESFVVRGQLNNAAIHMWQSSSLIGVGLGNFLVTIPQYLPSRTIYFLQPVHNIYLLLLSEVGVIGIGIIVWFIWSILRLPRKNKRTAGGFSVVPLLGILLVGLVDHYPFTLQQGRLLFVVFLGLYLTEKNR